MTILHPEHEIDVDIDGSFCELTTYELSERLTVIANVRTDANGVSEDAYFTVLATQDAMTRAHFTQIVEQLQAVLKASS